MKIFKFFQYAYLLFAAIFIYEAVSAYVEDNTIKYAPILLAAAAIFMFFFRKKFNKRFENRE